MNSLNENAQKEMLTYVDISALFNVNREFYSSGKAIIFSVMDYFLNAAEAEKFDNITVSI